MTPASPEGPPPGPDPRDDAAPSGREARGASSRGPRPARPSPSGSLEAERDAALLGRLLRAFGEGPLPAELLEPGRAAPALPEPLAELLADPGRRRSALERLEGSGAVERTEEGALRIRGPWAAAGGERPADEGTGEDGPERAPVFAAAVLLEAALRPDAEDPRSASRAPALAPHVLALADRAAAAEPGGGAGAVLRVLSRLASALSAGGRGEAALEVLDRAERLAGAAEPDDPFLPALIADQRAAALQDAGRREEGLAAARRAAELARSACPPDDPRLAVLWNNVGGAYKRAGDFLTAEVHFRRALDAAGRAASGASRRNVGGAGGARGVDRAPGGGPSTGSAVPPGLAATACLNLSDVLRARGRPREALPFARRALGETEDLRGAFAFETADAISNLASLLGELGEVEEARRQARRALVLYGRRLPEDHPLVVEARTLLESLEGTGGEEREDDGEEGEGRPEGAEG